MLREQRIQENAVIREAFLDLSRPIPSEYKVKLVGGKIPYGYIYCIENKKNGRSYIGSTYSLFNDVIDPSAFSQLKKRASHYIYEYNRYKEQSPSMVETLRPIIRALIQDGIENFVMYPVAETEYKTHLNLETFFIQKFKTYETGYNTRPIAEAMNNPATRCPMSAEGKKRRSEEVIAVNLNEKKIIFSDSMKLFADYTGTTKDLIKNVVRSCSQYKGWFVFYTNWNKREEVISKFVGGYCPARKNQVSDKAKKFFKELHENITRYLTEYKSEFFGDFELLESLRYN